MTQFGEAWALTPHSPPLQGTQLAGFYRCDNCQWPNAAIGGQVSQEILDRGRSGLSTSSQFNSTHNKAEHVWYPEKATGKTFEDVPQSIADAADEAFKCRSFHALRASVLMARSVVEATCKEKGIISGPLVTKIDSLEAEGHIRGHIKDAAHEIRHLGNNMAHGDFTEPVIVEEADEILEFMAEILHDVFQSPAKIARRKQMREDRKKQQ